MATSISSIGVGSGLPLDTLLADLRKAENAPLNALQTRANKEQQRFSAYGTLKSGLEAFSAAAAALGKSETFHAVKANVTGDSFTATVKPGSGAIPGNHSISVQQLASSQVMAGGRAETADKAVAAGATGMVDIEFTVSEGEDAANHTVSVKANASLQDIAKAINAHADLDFSATLMNDGEGHRLILSANSTGAANSITQINVAHQEGGSGSIAKLEGILNYSRVEPDPDNPVPLNPAAMGESVAGRDAFVTINGIEVTSQSNTLADAVEGVTLTLNKQTAQGAQPDSLELTRNDSVTTAAVNNFVSTYNALQTTIKSLTAYDVDSQTGAALSGDSLARRVQSQMRDSINGLAVNGITLSSLGISTDANTGHLSVDTEKLNEALTNNRADVEQLFAGENGLSKRVTAAAEVFTGSSGLIKTSQDGITRTLKLLEGQYEQMEARIDQKMETYRTQFVQLDTFMAQMNSVSNYLTTQLSMLENLGNSSKSK